MEAAATLIVAVAPLLGSVMVIVPAVPASMVSVAEVDDATVCAVIEAPEPVVESENVGVPGVPALQAVPLPVSVTLLPVELGVSVDGLTLKVASESSKLIAVCDGGEKLSSAKSIAVWLGGV